MRKLEWEPCLDVPQRISCAPEEFKRKIEPCTREELLSRFEKQLKQSSPHVTSVLWGF
jgi:hypothetical protein